MQNLKSCLTRDLIVSLGVLETYLIGMLFYVLLSSTTTRTELLLSAYSFSWPSYKHGTVASSVVNIFSCSRMSYNTLWRSFTAVDKIYKATFFVELFEKRPENVILEK